VEFIGIAYADAKGTKSRPPPTGASAWATLWEELLVNKFYTQRGLPKSGGQIVFVLQQIRSETNGMAYFYRKNPVLHNHIRPIESIFEFEMFYLPLVETAEQSLVFWAEAK
jgi:hypothetical protein